MREDKGASAVDWEAGLKALFDNGKMDFMGRHFGRGFPMDANRNLISWSDWLIGEIKAAAIAHPTPSGDPK